MATGTTRAGGHAGPHRPRLRTRRRPCPRPDAQHHRHRATVNHPTPLATVPHLLAQALSNLPAARHRERPRSPRGRGERGPPDLVNPLPIQHAPTSNAAAFLRALSLLLQPRHRAAKLTQFLASAVVSRLLRWPSSGSPRRSQLRSVCSEMPSSSALRGYACCWCGPVGPPQRGTPADRGTGSRHMDSSPGIGRPQRRDVHQTRPDQRQP
jgi:hypothetical protein